MLQVHDMVLSTAVVETFERIRPQHMDVARFWRGSVFRGLAASALARRAGLVDLGRVFTEGLMSDLGHMVLYAKAPQRAERAAQQARGQSWKLAQAEQALIGCDFAQVGAALTELWKLPACFGAAIRHQNTPQSADGYALEASLMHVAGMLAALPGGAQENATLIAHIQPSAWGALGLDASCVPDILEEVDTSLLAMARVFGVPLAG
jgi:HD-like signal output (HDOD) protein